MINPNRNYWGGIDYTGALPGVKTDSKAPTYSAAAMDAYMRGNAAGVGADPMLQATLTAGNQGAAAQGIGACLGRGFAPKDPESIEALQGLARGVGFDTSKYDLGADESGTEFYRKRG